MDFKGKFLLVFLTIGLLTAVQVPSLGINIEYDTRIFEDHPDPN